MPDATSLHHCLQNHHQYCTIVSCIQALDTIRPVASLAEGRRFVKYVPSPFYTANCSTVPNMGMRSVICHYSHTPPKCA